MPPYVRLQFPDIAPVTWEHPADAAALEALRAVPGFDRVVALTVGRLNELAVGRKLIRESEPATMDNAPRMTRLFRDVRLALDSPIRVPLRVKSFGGINAVTAGVDNPLIVMASEAEERLNDDEIKVILAHELGHILSGHVRYKIMLAMLLQIGWTAAVLPVSLPMVVAVALAMLEWERKSELSADRASALVAGGAGPVAATLREAGDERGVLWGHTRELPEQWRDLAARAALGAERVFFRHPPIGDRISALETWTQSDQWERIQAGAYPKRADRPRPGTLDSARSSLARLRSGVGEMAAAVGRGWT